MRLCVEKNKPVTNVMQGHKMYLISDGRVKTWIRAKELLTAVKCYNFSNARIQGQGVSVIRPQLKIERVNQENLNKIYLFMKYQIGYTEDPSSIYSYRNFVNNYEKDKEKCLRDYKGYVSFYGNQLVNWMTTFETLGCEVLTNMYYDGNYKMKDTIVNAIFEKNPDAIMSGHIYTTVDGNYSIMDDNSTIDSDYHYGISYGNYVTRGKTNRFVQSIEKKYFIREVDLKKIYFKVVDSKTLYNIWKSKYLDGSFNGYWINSCNTESAVGFHYFKFNDTNENAKFILAMYNGLIVGVIKLGVYYGNHQAIAYIDVLRTCRNQGIATYMIKNINKYLYKDLPLILTEESEMGKMCHMSEKFKASVKGIKVKTYAEALVDGKYD